MKIRDWTSAVVLFSISGLSFAGSPPYFADAYASLECMRQGAALIPDKALVVRGPGPCPIQVSPLPTSPSNIALDLLVQLEALPRPRYRKAAQANILRTINALQKLPRYVPSGLFHVRYTAGNAQEAPAVADSYLSAIDNLHIAFALWAIAKGGPVEARDSAKNLFSSMHLDFFYDPRDGLFVGGARLVDGKPVKEKWKYRYLGSEARSIYSIAWALRLIHDPDFLAKATGSLQADVFEWNEPGRGRTELLGLWDGGAFQLLLPRLLLSEELYLPRLGAMFKAYGRYVIAEGHLLGYPVPASYSACQLDLSAYVGRAGSRELVSPRDPDIADPDLRENWDKAFTPHAALLAAPLTSEISEALEGARRLTDSEGIPLYRPGLGWMDAFHVRGADAGRVIPVQLSLDQAMIALAVSETNEEVPMTAGARLLYDDSVLRARMNQFYRAVDEVLRHAPRFSLGVAPGTELKDGSPAAPVFRETSGSRF